MDEVKHHTHESDIKERGLSDFMDKKEQEEVVVVNEFEKVHLSGEGCDEDNEEKKLGLLRKLNRSNSSSSSSSSDEEVDDNKEKKKKGLKKKIKDKISGEKEDHDTAIPIEKVGGGADEKKGFVDKIKEKIPGGHPKKAAEDGGVQSGEVKGNEGEAAKEKKGIMEKIREKLPGYHKTGGE